MERDLHASGVGVGEHFNSVPKRIARVEPPHAGPAFVPLDGTARRGERLPWLVTLPIAVVGCEAAHAVTNATLGTADGDTAALAFGTGGDAELVTLIVSLAAVSVALALAGRAAGAWSTHRTAATRLP